MTSVGFATSCQFHLLTLVFDRYCSPPSPNLEGHKQTRALGQNLLPLELELEVCPSGHNFRAEWLVSNIPQLWSFDEWLTDIESTALAVSLGVQVKL